MTLVPMFFGGTVRFSSGGRFQPRFQFPELELVEAIVFSEGLATYRELLERAIVLADRRAERIPTPELNRFVNEVVAAHPPPQKRGKRLRLTVQLKDPSNNTRTKSVTINFEQTGSAVDPFGNTRVGFEGSTAINRKDWGLTWNAALETGGVLVSEKVKLEFDISAIKSA